MAKRSFGLAGAIEPGRKIFYESLFSQFQMGRMMDLFCAVGSDAGIQVSSLRSLLHAVLTEACRCQGLLDTSLGALDPVTVELGADSLQGAISVQFTVREGLEISPEMVKALLSAQPLAHGLAFRVDPSSRRAEISCFVPLDTGAPVASSEKEEPRFELVDSHELVDSAGHASGDPENEYVELGDIEYENLVSQDPAARTAEASLEPTRKILAAVGATPTEQATIAASPSQERLAQVLAGGLPEEDLAQAVKGAMNEEEIARTVAGGLPEEELAQIIKRGMSEEELARIVVGGLPEEELAQIIKGSSTPKELQKLVKISGDPAQIAEAVLSGSTKQEAAELIKAALPAEKIGEAIANSLSKGKLANLAAEALSPEELVHLARESLPQEQFAQTVKGGLTPKQAASFATHAIKSPEVCKAVLSSLSPNEIAQSLKAEAPQRIAEAVRAQAERMPRQQLIETLSDGLSREEFAKLVASSIPREEFSRILIDGLPPQELARSLYEGLPKEKFAQLASAVIPQEEITQRLASVNLEGSSAAAFGPTQGRLEPAQIAALLAPELTQRQALSVLSTVLPKGAVEGILTGAIPNEEIAEAIQPYLPPSESASPEPASPELAKKVTARLLEAKTEPAQAQAPVPSMAQPQSLEAKRTSAPSQSSTKVEKKAQLAQLEDAFQSQMQTLRKSVEFYVARTRNLETQLRAAEEARRSSQQEAQAAKLKLEGLLTESVTEARGTPTEAAPTEATPAEATPAESSRPETSAQGPKTARASPRPAVAGPERTEASQRSEPRAQRAEPGRAPSAAGAFSPGSEAQAAAKKAASDKGPAASDARAQRDAKRNKEALQFFQKKAREMEQDLRKAEAEVRRLNAEHTRQLLKLSQEKVAQQKQAPSARADVVPAAPGAQPHSSTASRAHSQSAFAPPSAAPSTSLGEPPLESASDTPNESTDAKADHDPALAHALATKIKQLETRLRLADEEKERLNRRLSEALVSSRPNSARAEPVRPDSTLTEAPRPTPSRPEPASAPSSNSAPADLALSSVSPTEPVQEAPRDSGAPEIAKPRASDRDGDAVDVGDKIEKTGVEVERDMITIAQKVQRLKESVPDGPARRLVDGLMTAVMQEKAKLMETSREMSKSVRKKELAFKNQEAMLTESVKQMRGLAEQRQAAIDRLKQQFSEIQQRIDRSQNQSGSNETQYRMKYEQSQRQIELLNKEIEKANRRLQQAPQTQGNNLAQERVMAEIRKQLENANKALTAKKQELEMTKIQINERDRREEQYKRQVMKLQSELLTARRKKAA